MLNGAPPAAYTKPNLPEGMHVARVIQASNGATEQTLDPEPEWTVTSTDLPTSSEEEEALILVLRRLLARLEDQPSEQAGFSSRVA